MKTTFKALVAVALAALTLSAPLAGFAAAENVKLTLGVVGGIYEDLWEPAQKALKAEGIDLEVVQFSDYVTPNNALNSGEIDLNTFQHHIFFDTELQQHGYELDVTGYTSIIPLNLYSHKVKSVAELKTGDVVLIPTT